MSCVLLALGVLAGGAIAALLAARWPRMGLLTALVATGCAGLLCMGAGGSVLLSDPAQALAVQWALPLGVARLALDNLSAWFLIVIGVVTVPVAIYTWGYFTTGHHGGPLGAFGPLLCVLVGAMVLVVSADDAVLFLVGWELMSLSAFFLVGFHDDEGARRGAWMYLMATHVGAAAGVLPLFAAFVARSGSTAFSGFGAAFGSADTGWCVAMFALAVIGFGTKAGFMPFHVWLPAAHPVAPSPVSALMSGLVIKTGIYALLRTLCWLPPLPVACSVALMALAVVTGLMGIIYALSQLQIKRLLAYSSVENIGIIGIALALGMLGRSLGHPILAALGFGGALLHVLNHALFKGLLFLSGGAVMHATGTGDIERLGGLARRTPVNALVFLIGAVAICALPPLNGFLSEFLIYTGLLRGLTTLPNGFGWVMVIAITALALIGGVALVAFSKVFGVVFLGERREPLAPVHATPWSMKAGMVLLAGACAAVSVGAAGIAPLLGAALKPVLSAADTSAVVLREALAPLTRVALMIGVLLIIAMGLVWARRRFAGWAGSEDASPAAAVGTWGCGFAAPTARMQYTASSYAWSLIGSLPRPLRSKRAKARLTDCFPQEARVSTQTADWALARLHRPMFIGLSRLFERCWPLQHGRVQLYLVYIVVTVTIVFLVEAAWGPRSPRAGTTHDAGSAPTHIREVRP